MKGRIAVAVVRGVALGIAVGIALSFALVCAVCAGLGTVRAVAYVTGVEDRAAIWIVLAAVAASSITWIWTRPGPWWEDKRP